MRSDAMRNSLFDIEVLMIKYVYDNIYDSIFGNFHDGILWQYSSSYCVRNIATT